MFSPLPKTNFNFSGTYILLTANAFELDQSTIYLFSKGLTLDWTKLKAFADDKSNVALAKISVFHRVENIVGNGDNTGYQHFLLFPQCFQQANFLGSLKIGIV